ncbi:MAG: tetratricopeptide repeat protein [Burkholderiales bacterium]|nr:tetratricopeptide repeat protein [Burkholderiales bacterium]
MKPRAPARVLAALIVCGATTAAGGAIDLDALWDFAQPQQSEQRFRAALASAQGDDALILRTQIARSDSLRGQSEAALAELDAIEPQLATAGAAARVHARLERGRVLRSALRPADAAVPLQQAFELADRAQLEFLATDALHMLALVQPTLEAQIAMNRRVLAYARNARDPRARRWEAVALNNIGVALNEAGRHEEALAELRQAQTAYERLGRVRNARVARWMVAHTLRLLGRLPEALSMQRALEVEWAADGQADAAVFDEIALIHAARGEAERAAYYRALAARAR